MTPEQITAATGCRSLTAAAFAPHLTSAMAEFGIDNPLRMAHFIAQCAHESMLFERTRESFNYLPETLIAVFPRYFYMPPSLPRTTLMRNANEYGRGAGRPAKESAIANFVYANRMGNGDETSGDGSKFSGKGLIQLTGRSNYQAFSNDSKFPCMTTPDVLTTDEAAAWSAGWFWKSRGCNEAADRDNIGDVTRIINGGVTGMPARVALTERSLIAFGVTKQE